VNQEQITGTLIVKSAIESVCGAIAAARLGHKVTGLRALVNSRGEGGLELAGHVPPHHWAWIKQAAETGIRLFAAPHTAQLCNHAATAQAALAALPPADPSACEPTMLAGPNWTGILLKHRRQVRRVSAYLAKARAAGDQNTVVTVTPSDLAPDDLSIGDRFPQGNGQAAGDTDDDTPPFEPNGWQDRIKPTADLLSGLGRSLRQHLSALNDDELDAAEQDAMAANERNCPPPIHLAAQFLKTHVAAEKAARSGKPAANLDDENAAGMLARI
jgi:hypothetical protein